MKTKLPSDVTESLVKEFDTYNPAEYSDVYREWKQKRNNRIDELNMEYEHKLDEVMGDKPFWDMELAMEQMCKGLLDDLGVDVYADGAGNVHVFTLYGTLTEIPLSDLIAEDMQQKALCDD